LKEREKIKKEKRREEKRREEKRRELCDYHNLSTYEVSDS